MKPDPVTAEFTVFSIHPGVTKEMIIENTGWDVQFIDDPAITPAPTQEEIDVLVDLNKRTQEAHSGKDA